MPFDVGKPNDVAEFDGAKNKIDLGFDPDKLIDPQEVNASRGSFRDESSRTDPEVLTAEVPGLAETQQETRTLENGNTLFDSPEETGRTLNSDQGNAVEGFKGDCGLVSVENVARLAGKEVTEADVIDVALENGLCDSGSQYPEVNGGVTIDNIVDVLKAIGIDAHCLERPTREELAQEIEAGKGVIASVNTLFFWGDFPFGGNHAVTVTSVERNPDGNVAAFYVCDSGTGGEDYARRIGANYFELSTHGFDSMVVTDRPIR